MLLSRLITVVGAKLRTALGLGIIVGGIGISNYTSHRARAPSFKTDYFKFSESDLQSDDALWALYERWRRHYRMGRWRSREEMERRFENFKDSSIRSHEAKAMNLGYTLCLAKTSDCSRVERMTYIFPDDFDPEKHSKFLEELANNYLTDPDVDARADAYPCCACCDQLD